MSDLVTSNSSVTTELDRCKLRLETLDKELHLGVGLSRSAELRAEKAAILAEIEGLEIALRAAPNKLLP